MAFSTLALGQQTEAIAAGYLQRHGLKILYTNYRCKVGEIDLICKDGNTHLVFVEVRYRKSTLFGGALESITFQKQQKLARTAAYFLKCHSWASPLFCRFDVIALSPKKHARMADICSDSLDILWLKNAFSCR